VGVLEQLGCWLNPACQTGKLPSSFIPCWISFQQSKRVDWMYIHQGTPEDS